MVLGSADNYVCLYSIENMAKKLKTFQVECPVLAYFKNGRRLTGLFIGMIAKKAIIDYFILLVQCQ